MNRFKKEEARAHHKAREGLSGAEVKLVNEQHALNERISGKPLCLDSSIT